MPYEDLDKWFLQYNTRAVHGKSKSPFSGGRAKPLKQGTALTNLRAAAKKHPEVMVKIPKRGSGNSKGMKGIRNHLDYVSRNGEVPLETDAGDILSGKKTVRAHADLWRDAFGIAEDTKHREALNIVLSMPAGTPPQAVLNAAREFAVEQFPNRRYAFGLHHESEQPGEPPHPHVHLCVLMRDGYGQRLNPRKNDLFEWRVRFAEKLRDEGVQCAATRRQHRGKTTKAENSIVRAIKKRGAAPKAVAGIQQELAAAIQEDRTPIAPFAYKTRQPEKYRRELEAWARETAAATAENREAVHPFQRQSKETREVLQQQYKSLAKQLYAAGMKTAAKDIAALAHQLSETAYDTRIQQAYQQEKAEAEKSRLKRNTRKKRQPENPVPKHRDDEIER